MFYNYAWLNIKKCFYDYMVETQQTVVCCCSWLTFWTLFKYWLGNWHSALKRLNCWRKAVYKYKYKYKYLLQSCIHYSWIFNAQMHVYLKKWTLKFELLYLLNHISCFNEICGEGHCAWILAYKVRKSGSNPHYPCWSKEVFSKGNCF